MREVHGNNKVKQRNPKHKLCGSSNFCKQQTCRFSFPSSNKHCEMTQATVWLPESKDLMGEVASLYGEVTGSRRRRLWYLHYFFWSRLKMALSALYSQHVHTDLPKACHSILHSPATSIKEKRKTPCCYMSSPSPHNFLSFLYFLPPSHHQLISDMQSPFYLFFMSRWPWLSAPY